MRKSYLPGLLTRVIKSKSVKLFAGIFIFLMAMMPETGWAATPNYYITGLNAYSANQPLCNTSTPSNITATFNVSSCNSSGNGSNTQTYTVTWYYNTTGVTSNTGAGSTQVQQNTAQSSGTVSTVTYTLNAANIVSPPVGTTYYYYCVLSAPNPTTISLCTANGIATFPYTAASSVTVQKLAAVNYGTVSSGDQSICSGVTPNSMSVTGATGSGSFNYQWYSQTGLVSCPSGSSIVGWTSLGATNGANTSTYTPVIGISNSTTYAVLVTPSGAPTCGTATWSTNCRKVTVNPLPSVASITPATPSVCVGNTTALSDATAGGSWSSSDNSKATIDAFGVATGVAVGGANNYVYYGGRW